MAITKAQRDKTIAQRGSGTHPFTPESLRQQTLAAAGITEAEQAKMVKEVWSGIKSGLKANDEHVSVVGLDVVTTTVPNHAARSKARDQALDIVGIRAPRVNSAVVTKISVRMNMPDWSKPSKDKNIIDVSPTTVDVPK